MERLTYRDKDGFPMMKKRGGFKQGGVERLAAYEDTGLTPKEAKRMSNILMDVGIDYTCSWEYVKNWLLDDRLRELAEADKDGRVVVHGHRVDDGGFYARCSQCDGVLPLCANYCPNCGAKMDGGADNA